MKGNGERKGKERQVKSAEAKTEFILLRQGSESGKLTSLSPPFLSSHSVLFFCVPMCSSVEETEADGHHSDRFS